MDILLYLSELLKQQTSVGIADLGTFYKKKFAGRYDKEKQSFLPPGYTLQFTASLKEENLLPDFIAAKRNISKESAEYYISQFVEETNKKLEIEHEAELENIGRLFYTEHEGLSFEPSKDVNYGSEFYGLPDVKETEQANETAPVEQIQEAKSELSIAEEKTVDNVHHQVSPIIENVDLDEVNDDLKHTLSNSEYKHNDIVDVEHEELNVPESILAQHEENPNRFGHQPESEEPKTYVNLNEDVSTEKPVSEAPEFIKQQHAEHPNRFGHDPSAHEIIEDEEEKSNWPKVWIGVAILLVIAAIVYFAKPELFNRQEKVAEKQNTPVIDSVKTVNIDSAKLKQDSIAKTDSILKANQVQNKIDSQKAKPVTTVKPATTNLAPQKTGVTTYEVIGASFKTTKKAEQFVAQMKGYGLKARIVPIEGPYKKVSIASFKTEKEAIDARPVLSKKVRIKELDIKQINTP
ncbi:HU domain-containing protein [Pedobacter jamesrossensis]|uniref:SPOR domain-containing protein n=1 Tax=Pedobacter jamesrossensis TaxID=1908238 RepID=A0ABV8NHT0_9SPHI